MPFYCNSEGKTNKVFIHRRSTGETTLYGLYAVPEVANRAAHRLITNDDDIDEVTIRQASGWVLTLDRTH
jgi:hypothetical protein